MPEVKHSTLFHQLKTAWRWVTWLLIGIVVLFTLLLLSQAWTWVRAASDVHPIFGWAVALAILAGVGFLVGIPIKKYLETPKVIEPPELSDSGTTPADARKTVTYLDSVLVHASRNRHLVETLPLIEPARQELARLKTRAESLSEAESAKFAGELASWANKTLTPIWAPVERRVDQLIYKEALNVGIATAVSPNGTLDAYLMLWRSANLVGEIAALNYGRPGLIGTVRVCRDVAVAVAVAGTIQSFTDSLGNLAMHSIGGAAGLLAGPVTEGATNALVLTRIGYLAQARCRAFRPWNKQTQTEALFSALSATQKVAFGLTCEIARKAGTGLGAFAGAAASGVGMVMESAADRMAAAAGAAVQTANQWGTSLKSRFFGTSSATAE